MDTDPSMTQIGLGCQMLSYVDLPCLKQKLHRIMQGLCWLLKPSIAEIDPRISCIHTSVEERIWAAVTATPLQLDGCVVCMEGLFHEKRGVTAKNGLVVRDDK